MPNLASILKVILPKKSNPKGVAVTETFNPTSTNNILALPAYREHLTDVFTTRSANDSRTLLKSLFQNDPDMSASVNAFLTVADTPLRYLTYDATGQVDEAGQALVEQLVTALTTRTDYSKGFKQVQSLNAICEAMRYMMLLRGGVGAEAVITPFFSVGEIRQVDMGRIEWYEKAAGQYTPQQRDKNGNIISLDIPTFFATWFRRDPTDIYTTSPFVSAINTIACRQQVINDLYRIMQVTGFPRMEFTVLEEVLLKNAPANARIDSAAQQEYIRTRMGEITAAINGLRSDESFVHTDSVETGMMNEKAAGSTLNIDSVMQALNAQNQAGLRTMATIIGRGESGVNTATVEARVFSMNAEQLNKPIADILSQILTFALRLQGNESNVVCHFDPVEMRSALELETQLSVRAARLKSDLSLGLISDAEYSLQMYGRLPLPGSTPLSGTNFDGGNKPAMAETQAALAPDPTANPANPSALDKAAKTSKGTKPIRSNSMGKNQLKKPGA